MEILLIQLILTFLLLVGAIVDYFVTPLSRQSVYHGNAFPMDPKQVPGMERRPMRTPDYVRAA